MSTQKERLIEFVNYLGLSKRAFERSVGASLATIANSKERLSYGFIEKITSTYPILNRVWLLTGEGEMIIRQQETLTIAPNYGNQQVGDGNHMAIAGAEEIEQLRARVQELEKELQEKDKTIARLEGKIELYKEMMK